MPERDHRRGTKQEDAQGLYLGFDFGLRRTGVAVGEATTGTARALTTLSCRDGNPDWEEVGRLIAQWQPHGLVVGIPRHADGSLPTAGEAACRFSRRLEGRFRLPTYTVDEHLSSHEAARELGERGLSGQRMRRQKAKIDATAARIILETWFLEHAQ
ncbi:Holliday junction resolvase RuvX [Alkalilimnicola ehrlichii]|uniref:Putative pre-16S rRNA nuclease n=1 Tax=Alkalilimnicola ehrlichii TaxID=351052 RepID=A0A3E0X1I3_9GAMM|nr:Holliday junction resolvase RuvX [Alkalilimnicola ehrlichii]RFA39513.1 Holliday junction resolvase RuvX [Alkalilimnicola ehrlichii]